MVPLLAVSAHGSERCVFHISGGVLISLSIAAGADSISVFFLINGYGGHESEEIRNSCASS